MVHIKSNHCSGIWKTWRSSLHQNFRIGIRIVVEPLSFAELLAKCTAAVTMRFSSSVFLALAATSIAFPIYKDPSPLSAIESIPQSLTQAHALSERGCTAGGPNECNLWKNEAGHENIVADVVSGKTSTAWKRESCNTKSTKCLGERGLPVVPDAAAVLPTSDSDAGYEKPKVKSDVSAWKRDPCTGGKSKTCLWKRTVGFFDGLFPKEEKEFPKIHSDMEKSS